MSLQIPHMSNYSDSSRYSSREAVSLPLALAGATSSFIDIYEEVIRQELNNNAKQSGSNVSYCRSKLGELELTTD